MYKYSETMGSYLNLYFLKDCSPIYEQIFWNNINQNFLKDWIPINVQIFWNNKFWFKTEFSETISSELNLNFMKAWIQINVQIFRHCFRIFVHDLGSNLSENSGLNQNPLFQTLKDWILIWLQISFNKSGFDFTWYKIE